MSPWLFAAVIIKYHKEDRNTVTFQELELTYWRFPDYRVDIWLENLFIIAFEKFS